MKRGITTFSVIMGVILTLALGVVLLLLIKNVGQFNIETSQKQICKSSVEQHVLGQFRTKIPFIRQWTPEPEIKCPTKYITIKGSDEEKIKREMAGEMYDCWDVFGEGRLELFKENTVYCSVCSVIDFEKKDKKIAGFYNYLNEKNPPNKEVTYMQYLKGYKTKGAEELLKPATEEEKKVMESLGKETISTDKEYAVIFLYARGLDEIKQTLEYLGNVATGSGTSVVIAGGVALLVAGAVADMTVVGLPAGLALQAIGGTMVFSGSLWNLVEGWFKTNKEPDWVSFVVFKEYNAEELTKLGCKYLPSKQK